MEQQYFEEENVKRLQDFYNSMDKTSDDGHRLTEADEEKEDPKLLGKKRKLTDSQDNDSSQNGTKFEKNENIVVSEDQKEVKTEEHHESNVEEPDHQNTLTLKIDSELSENRAPNPIMNTGRFYNIPHYIDVNQSEDSEELEESDEEVLSYESTEASIHLVDEEDNGSNNDEGS